MACLETYVLGVDVAKAQLECARPDRRSVQTIENTADAIAELVAELQARQAEGVDVLVIVEASGGQERRLRFCLDAAGIPIHVANAKRVRDYARAIGYEAKTDRIDARLLRRYGESERPRPTPPVDAERQELGELLNHRAQVQAEITARRQQLAQYDSPAVRQPAEAALARLHDECAEITELLEARLRTPRFEADCAILCSFPGVSTITAAVILANLPELGQVSSKRIASLAGVAPFACDSGQFKGRRMIRGGRAHLRTALYMPAAVAARHNPQLRAKAERLKANNKPEKLVRTALMRHMLTILNAMMRKRTHWQNPNTTNLAEAA